MYKQSFSCKINCTNVKWTATKLHKSPDETDGARRPESEYPSNERLQLRLHAAAWQTHYHYHKQLYSIILYADDILLLSLSVTRLEQLLHACECELTGLDMSINFSKSCCLRIGRRFDIPAAGVNSLLV